VHFGDSDFLTRYRSYQQHLAEWRQQYPHLSSVDMRYENQVVLDMTPQANPKPSPDTASKHPAGHPAGKPAGHSPGPSKGSKAAKAKSE
jgi:cell division protein FtsQ